VTKTAFVNARNERALLASCFVRKARVVFLLLFGRGVISSSVLLVFLGFWKFLAILLFRFVWDCMIF
jgi:hypothetical protein